MDPLRVSRACMRALNPDPPPPPHTHTVSYWPGAAAPRAQRPAGRGLGCAHGEGSTRVGGGRGCLGRCLGAGTPPRCGGWWAAGARLQGRHTGPPGPGWSPWAARRAAPRPGQQGVGGGQGGSGGCEGVRACGGPVQLAASTPHPPSAVQALPASCARSARCGPCPEKAAATRRRSLRAGGPRRRRQFGDRSQSHHAQSHPTSRLLPAQGETGLGGAGLGDMRPLPRRTLRASCVRRNARLTNGAHG